MLSHKLGVTRKPNRSFRNFRYQLMLQVCIISILLCISGIGAWFKITVFSYLYVVSDTVVTISVKCLLKYCKL